MRKALISWIPVIPFILLIVGCRETLDSKIVLEIDGQENSISLNDSEETIAEMLAKSDWSHVRLKATSKNLDLDLQYYYVYTPDNQFPHSLLLRDQRIIAIENRDGISGELANQIYQNLHSGY